MLKKYFVITLFIILTGASLFSEENKTLYPFKDNIISGKYGYINKTGKIIIKPIFAEAGLFINGMAIVKKISSEGSGFINLEGNLIYSAPSYLAVIIQNGFRAIRVWDEVYNFNEGMAVVTITTDNNDPNTTLLGWDSDKLDRKFGFINKSGKFAIKAKYDEAWSFCGGFAVVYSRLNGNRTVVMIDKQGKEYDILPVYVKENDKNKSHIGFFRNGLLAVKLANKKWGFIDIKGNIVIKPQYDCIGFEKSEYGNEVKEIIIPYFYKGKALVKKTDKIYLINKKNEVLKELECAYISDFSDDVAFTYNPEFRVTGAIDIDGNKLFDNTKNRTYGDFSDGLCWFEDIETSENLEATDDAIKVPNKGYIDKTGKVVLDCSQYKSLGNFVDGIADVEKEISKKKEDGNYSNLDKQGEIIYIDKTGKIIFGQ